MPEVSVIIPTYNRATMVCEAIESVINQTLSNLEVIVVDDGSTDNTADVLRGCYDERVKYYYQPNRGRSAARNHGISAANGRYLLFLDSDDMLLPRALEHEAAYLDAHPDIDLVYTDGYFCDPDGVNFAQIAPARPSHSTDNILKDIVISNVILACHSVMVRRRALESIAPPYFDETLRGTEDEDLWIRLAARGSNFACLDVITCKYRVHSSNASRHDPSSPQFWKRQESVKRSRFKILNADFFFDLPAETRERFFYSLLLSQLTGDEPSRRVALASTAFLELPKAVRARLLYYLGVSNIVDDGAISVGRSRLEESVDLMPGSRKYRGVLMLSYLGRPPLGGLVLARRLVNRVRRNRGSVSPIGRGGLQSV